MIGTQKMRGVSTVDTVESVNIHLVIFAKVVAGTIPTPRQCPNGNETSFDFQSSG